MTAPGFLDKLIGRLGRVRPEEAQAHLLRVVREKGFFEAIFNTIQEGILVTDPAGRITYLNAASHQFFGIDDSCLGQPLSECVRGLDWESLTRAAEALVSRDMQVFYPQERFLNFYLVPLQAHHLAPPTRASRRVAAKAAKAGGVSEGPAAWAMIVRDITETRRSTAETIESERLNALTLLAAGVAHELGNPLNSLGIHLQLLERKVRRLDDPAARAGLDEEIRVARDEIRRLDFIVSQFLRAIRPSRPLLRPDDLNAVVREAVGFLAAELEDRRVLAETDLDESLPLLALDRDQIKQAFYNLIKNASQAMPDGGVLRIRTAREPGHAAVSFEDTGGGISAENLSKVFQPYFTTKGAGGSGLGLMIVRRIVREHGGEIELQSTEGRGLTVTVRLPLGERQVQMLPAEAESET